MQRKPFFTASGTKRKRGSETSTSSPLNNEESVRIYWDRLYRYVENYQDLFGESVHVSKGELSASFFKDQQDYAVVPFSHTSKTGALFEMREDEEGMLNLTSKDYQPGTGVAEYLGKESVTITRVFYEPRHTNPQLAEKLNQLSKKGIELVPIRFSDYMSDKIDKIELVLPDVKRRRKEF